MVMKTLEEIIKEHLKVVLSSTNWDLQSAARLLKISTSELESRIEEFSLTKENS